MGRSRTKYICAKSGMISRRFAPCVDCPHTKDTCPDVHKLEGPGKSRQVKVIRAALQDPVLQVNKDGDGRLWLAHKYYDDVAGTGKMRMMSMDGWRCLVCGSRENLTVDHVVPQIMGGKDEQYNLQCLCYDCNQLKGFEPCDYRHGNRFVGWKDIWFDSRREAAVKRFNRAMRFLSNERFIEYHNKNRERAARAKDNTKAQKHP